MTMLPWWLGMIVAVLCWMFLRDEPQPEAPRRFGGGAIG
jgi:hypothetical protein